MPKFKSENPACGKLFHYAAKLTSTLSASEETAKVAEAQGLPLFDSIEVLVCPFCKSKEYTEFVDPVPAPEEIANVYIYELSSGPQTVLDGLLAQGYKIVNRYAKAYHLEKPKAKLDAIKPAIELTVDEAANQCGGCKGNLTLEA